MHQRQLKQCTRKRLLGAHCVIFQKTAYENTTYRCLQKNMCAQKNEYVMNSILTLKKSLKVTCHTPF